MAMNDVLSSPLPFTVVAGSYTLSSYDNLKNERLGRASKVAASGGTQYLVADVGSVRAINLVSLLATNADAGAQIRVRVGTTLAAVNGATPPGPFLYDSGAGKTLWASADAARRLHRQSFTQFDSVNGRYVRVEISGTALAALNAGRLVIGGALVASDTIDFGWSYSVVDWSDVKRTQAAMDDIVLRGRALRFKWTWSWINEEEARGPLLDILAYAGNSRPIFTCLNPDAEDLHNVIGYGLLKEEVEGVNRSTDAYEATFHLESRLILSL
jgi:hypothetical protein